MIAVLPGWVSDSGAVIGICAAATVVIGAIATGVILAVRRIVQPAIDKVNETMSAHMAHEEIQIDRIAIALDMIANALHLHLPSIRVSGGSDEGDPEAP